MHHSLNKRYGQPPVTNETALQAQHPNTASLPPALASSKYLSTQLQDRENYFAPTNQRNLPAAVGPLFIPAPPPTACAAAASDRVCLSGGTGSLLALSRQKTGPTPLSPGTARNDQLRKPSQALNESRGDTKLCMKANPDTAQFSRPPFIATPSHAFLPVRARRHWK